MPLKSMPGTSGNSSHQAGLLVCKPPGTVALYSCLEKVA